jgi:hypothetical protein
VQIATFKIRCDSYTNDVLSNWHAGKRILRFGRNSSVRTEATLQLQIVQLQIVVLGAPPRQGNILMIEENSSSATAASRGNAHSTGIVMFGVMVVRL